MCTTLSFYYRISFIYIVSHFFNTTSLKLHLLFCIFIKAFFVLIRSGRRVIDGNVWSKGEDCDSLFSGERSQKYKELKKREETMNEFLETFDENKQAEVERMKQMEQNTVLILENMSRVRAWSYCIKPTVHAVQKLHSCSYNVHACISF